jgi:peptidyl-tRNA hydrolase, PTH1 family
MKLIVGLGNPGIEYQFTPHNLGFLTVDRLADRHKAAVNNRFARALTGKAKVGPEEVLLAKPETFMNLSGISVQEIVSKYEVAVATDLIIVHDELDLPYPGAYGNSAGTSGA